MSAAQRRPCGAYITIGRVHKLDHQRRVVQPQRPQGQLDRRRRLDSDELLREGGDVDEHNIHLERHDADSEGRL